MQVLVVGASGMLGHKVLRAFTEAGVEATGVIRREPSTLPTALRPVFWQAPNTPDSLVASIKEIRPDFIVNCAGAVKQRIGADDRAVAYEANVELPFRLSRTAAELGASLIHVSTDCVFKGEVEGPRPFRISDIPSATDLYGISKRIGELAAPTAMTLRTSIVGPELFSHTGLFDWAVAQRDRDVRGFRRAIFTGVPTAWLAQEIVSIVRGGRFLPGVHQVASRPIDKFTWLSSLNEQLGLNLRITEDRDYYCDRSLDGSEYVAQRGAPVPSWDELMDMLVSDYRSHLDWYEVRP